MTNTPPSAPHIIILAAGKGTRMRSPIPKVLHPLAGFPLIWHVVRLAESLNPRAITCVISEDLTPFFADSPHRIVQQGNPLGTGHAVQVALSAAEDLTNAPTLVLYGDTPLLTGETLQPLIEGIKNIKNPCDVALLTFQAALPNPYGRVMTNQDHRVTRIVEAKDLSPLEASDATLPLNAGVMAFGAGVLPRVLHNLQPQNAQGELYLTDTVGLMHHEGGHVVSYPAPAQEVIGINTQQELQTAEALYQARLLKRHQDAGVRMGPTVILSADTVLAAGCAVESHVVLGPNVRVETGAIIHSFSHLTGCTIGANASIGPFARLRPKTTVGEACHIGNFVELKAATLGVGVKAGHLSYLGDAHIGDHCNIGAGTITCNYDGQNKHQTILEDGVFVGSNTALVAPVTVHQGAYIGAGSVITETVPAQSLALSRAPLRFVQDWLKRRHHNPKD